METPNLQEEKAKLEAEVKNCESIIEAHRRNIHWFKKRIRLVEAQIESEPEVRTLIGVAPSGEDLKEITKNLK